MKKKTLQKISRLFASLVLVGAMSLGTVTTANAAGGPQIYGENDTPTAGITVEYKMAKDVVTPAASTTFTFTKAATGQPEGATVPELSVNPISFTQGSNDGLDSSVTDSKVLRKQSENFLTGFIAALNNGKMTTGEYKYTVSSTTKITPNKEGDSYIASQAEYNISIFVAQKTDKTLYIKGLGITESKNDKGDAGSNKKVDATPGDGTSSGNFSDLKFVNEYVAKAGGTGPDVPNPSDSSTYAFKVTDTEVDGTSNGFAYKMTVKKPVGVTTKENTYTYYIFDEKGAKVSEISAQYGDEADFALKNGYSMVIKSCYAGSTVNVTQTGQSNWVASALPTFNGVASTKAETAAMGLDLTIANKTIGQKENKVEYTNKYSDIAVTGIIVNNFPFVMMIVMAMAAFVAIVAVKSRRRMNER